MRGMHADVWRSEIQAEVEAENGGEPIKGFEPLRAGGRRPGSRPGDALLGSSAAMREVRRQIRMLAPVPSTVLLTGETGVGKGLAARALHGAVGRGRGAFVHVDCASLSPSLVESELFGHERGAFTGALAQRAGCFERAGSGTLFLDEIGELEGHLQSKLLRVLQDREFERIGGSVTLPVRARIVAATSRDLRREVREGRFRSDLYFRLDVLRLEIPPLRERREDVADLVREGARQVSARLGRRPPVVSDALCEALARRPWPGNVRELLNAVERLLILRPVERLEADALDGLLDEPPQPAPRAEGPERIEAALREAGGNVARAARVLGVPRSTLRRRIRSSGLSPSSVTSAEADPSLPSGSGAGRST